MGFTKSSSRERARGGLKRPGNKSENVSPYISAVVPPRVHERLTDEAFRRGVPVSHVIRESLCARYSLMEEIAR